MLQKPLNTKLHRIDSQFCIIYTTPIMMFSATIHLLWTCVSVHTQKVQREQVHVMIRFDNTHTFLILLAYCFMAIFSTVLSKPKKDLMSRLAVCSKHVHSSFSGWTCTNTHTNTYCILCCIHMQKQDDQVTMVTTHPASLDDDARGEQFSHCALWGGVCVSVWPCKTGQPFTHE